MNIALDETHDPRRRSLVAAANAPGADFPIQNLPLGVFGRVGESTRAGMAIGDQILDLRAAHKLGLLPADIPEQAVAGGALNVLFSLGPEPLRALRRRVSNLLDAASGAESTEVNLHDLLVPMAACTLHRPTHVGNYTDFYAGIHHARAAGALLTPENPLPDNYKWVPIAYHGRASSVQVSGGRVRRPKGQRPPGTVGAEPSFGPSERLDFELEMGFYIGGGNARGEPIPIREAAESIVGFSLLNDWSARDLQRWEMFPLGPFLSKSFATSVSPWVVTADALAPFRVPAMRRPDGDPQPLRYLRDEADQSCGGLSIALEVLLSTGRMRSQGLAPVRLMTSNARHLYWTPAQMVAHHTVNGCNLQDGDLIGTGTISGPSAHELSSMLEFTVGGTQPVLLPNGEQRSFLLDGDEVIFHGRCERDGFVGIGFGACTGIIEPSADEGDVHPVEPT